jgi:sugar lactone lactonase YvrE
MIESIDRTVDRMARVPCRRRTAGAGRAAACLTVLTAAIASAPYDASAEAGAPLDSTPPCVTAGGLEPICGLQAPEDLTVFPEGGRLLVVQMHGPTHLPVSNLVELDLATQRVRVLPVVATERAVGTDASCTAPDPAPDLHGFDLARDASGQLQLLVVNHGSRQSIEFFRVVGSAADRALEWRGCIATPADVRLNDVAVRPGGGLVATVMGEARYFDSADGFDFLVSGADTGYLLAWSPGGGFHKLSGTEAAFPNGIAIDAAGRYAWFAARGGLEEVS